MKALKIVCRECGCSIILTEKDIRFYKQKGFQPPRRCRKCREIAANQDYATPKELGLKQSSFGDYLKVFGMPEDVKKEHPNDGLWFGL